MPYIQPNILLTPTEKLIKPYECSFIVIEGPNLKGKLNLEGLEIKYDSFYLSQLTLNESAKDQPLVYGFLGSDITFLMIRAKYMPLDPYWQVETEQYIEYYFNDNPSEIRTMGQLMVMSGNSVKRISQMFLNNPSSVYKVQIEVLMANLPQSSIANPNQYNQNSFISGLYYNSIISNQVISSITGSTELKILDIDSVPVMIIPYSNIRTIVKIDSKTLLIGNDTEEKIKLEFLSEYNCDQANSRINWVLESPSTRVLTKSSPSPDNDGPVILWDTSVSTGTTTGVTTGTIELYLLPSGVTYSITGLTDMLVSGVTDNRDGTIDKTSISLVVKPLYDLVPLTGVTEIGIYELTFDVKDLANNNVTYIKYLSIYHGSYSTGFWDDDGVWIDVEIWVD